jgi:hypothetical protein
VCVLLSGVRQEGVVCNESLDWPALRSITAISLGSVSYEPFWSHPVSRTLIYIDIYILFNVPTYPQYQSLISIRFFWSR